MESLYKSFDLTQISFLESMSFFSTAETITILLIFNFMQLLVVTAFSELVWPTQNFNRKHSTGYTQYRLRTYTETITKLKGHTRLYKVYNFVINKNFFNKN